MIVPRRNKCRLPHIRADGTHSVPAIPTPKRKYPVRTAILVKLTTKINDNVKVFAARMGPRDVAKIETTERMRRIISRFQSGQFYRYGVSRESIMKTEFVQEDHSGRHWVVGLEWWVQVQRYRILSP
jgi:hypothetical protein